MLGLKGADDIRVFEAVASFKHVNVDSPFLEDYSLYSLFAQRALKYALDCSLMLIEF